MADNTGKCNVCDNFANRKCSNCQIVFYCSKEHQKSDWKTHKKLCKPIKICHDEIIGRYLVATRSIKPGEIILQEPPLIWGPTQDTVPVCLGCGNSIDENNFRPCMKCGWPVCSEICEKSPSHIPECQYTVTRGAKVTVSNFGITHPMYQCITVLRCLYQKQFLSSIWKKIDKLESHCEQRKKTTKYEKDRIQVAQFILRFFKINNVSEEEILKICGILMVNGHEVPLTSPSHVALYETTSMFEHDCSANCNKTFTNQGSILIKAGVLINPGDHLSICYTDPLWGTENRQHQLYESKFFHCSCKRCSDPTEFQTYLSAMKCQNNDCNGYLLPSSFLTNGKNSSKLPSWNCDKCNHSLSSQHTHDLLERIGEELYELKKGHLDVALDFIKSHEKYLHPNHYYLTDIRMSLSQMIGYQSNGKFSVTEDEDLQFKIQFCQQVLKLIEILAPGEVRLKGLLLFELHVGLVELGKRTNSPCELECMLLQAKKILQETADLLKYEPASLHEGKIYRQSLKGLKDIETVLNSLNKSTNGNLSIS